MCASETRVYVCDEVRAVQQLHRDLLTDEFRQLPIREQLDQQAQRILEAHRAGDKSVATHLKCWHRESAGRSVEEIMTCDLALEDARQTIAREYGFIDWDDVEQRGTQPPDLGFESAVETALSGDVDGLRSLLERDRSLVQKRSSFGHRSTLLHYVGSNGVETYRQVVPYNLAEIAKILVEAGADVHATAEIYGGGVTAMALLTTSDHPAKAGVMDEVVQVLLEAGA